MKIARILPLSGRHVEWYSPFPAPSLRELSSECETEGVSFDEWYSVKISEFRRGDENRLPTVRFCKYPDEWQNIPARIKSKNHPPADETSSGRVIDIMGDVARLPP